MRVRIRLEVVKNTNSYREDVIIYMGGNMKKYRIKIISILAVLCILVHTKPVYAEEMGDITETSSEQTEVVEEQEVPGGIEQQPEELQMPELSEEQLSVPEKIKDLRTTCKSDTSVLLEWSKSESATTYEIYRKQGKTAYKKITTVDKTSYVDKTIKYGESYCYKVVPRNKNKEAGKSATINLHNRQAVNISSKKYSYAQMKADMKELKAQYSDYCEMEEIGKTVNGRTIYDFSIGAPEAKRSLLVVSTLHGREYICSVVIMKEIQYYLRNYNKSIGGMVPAEVLKNMKIHYIVMANPDGVMISQTKYARWKSNARGVDLNRNFPVKKFNVGGKKGAEGYSGPKALSEPETVAVANLTKKLKKEKKLCGVINYHAMGNIIYGSCESRKISKDTKTMYRIAKAETGYKRAISSNSTSPGGQYRDYVMYMLNLPSITIEVGSTSAPCSYWQYEPEFQKNKLVVLKIAKAL